MGPGVLRGSFHRRVVGKDEEVIGWSQRLRKLLEGSAEPGLGEWPGLMFLSQLGAWARGQELE